MQGIAFADLNKQGAQEAAEESKTYARHAEFKALAIKVDVADETSVQSMVDLVVKEFGRIDYAVNSAGVSDHVCNIPSSLLSYPGDEHHTKWKHPQSLLLAHICQPKASCYFVQNADR